MVCGHSLYLYEVGQMCKEMFSERGFSPAYMPFPDPLVRAMAYVKPELRGFVDALGKKTEHYDHKLKKDLGFECRPLRDTVRDTMESLIEFEIIHPPSTVLRTAVWVGGAAAVGLVAYGVGRYFELKLW